MNKEEAIKVLNDYDINFEGHTPEEVAEAHEMAIKAIFRTIPNENEQIIRISKGTLKARTGRYVVYDVEWLKKHFNTTEAKIYGQPNEDCISRKAVLDALHRYFADGFDSDKWWNSTYVLDAVNRVPSITPQPKEEPQQKTGHWIWCASSHKCSNCGGYVCFSHKKLLKYCPECGAKMQEEKK